MYLYEGIFASLRIILCFYLLFGVIAPLFLPKVEKESKIDGLMYSWLGLGGLITIDVLILTFLNIYDFISLFVTLIVTPFIVYLVINLRKGLTMIEVLSSIETKIISQHVRVIENTLSLRDRIKSRASDIPRPSIKENKFQLLAFVFAAGAALLRILPAVNNSAPFSRVWYFELTKVKALSLQTYFDGFPEPKGLHTLVNVFSTLTQVTPELILHLLGALTSFLLALIIFWVINVITERKNQVASLLGMSIYSFVPMLITPIILESEVEANSLSLALCFAIPTGVFFLKQLRSTKALWFYIAMGIFATALVNLFVFLIVLLPVLFLSLLTISVREIKTKLFRSFSFLSVISFIAFSPYLIFCIYHNISLRDFLQQELFDTLVFSYFPQLLIPLDALSTYFFTTGIALALIFSVLVIAKKTQRKEELVFFLFFALVAYIYTPYFPYSYILIDPDQLNLFYAFLISVFVGVSFFSISRILNLLLKRREKVFNYLNSSLGVLTIVGLLFLQKGIFVSRALPETLPNGFFNAYYIIVGERIPYSYATVGPELDRRLAENRHYFMNYEFFLDNYGAIDSLYQQYLLVPKAQRETKEIPPASIFLFLEKPPYTTIQQGILYNSTSIMNDMQQWIDVFSGMDGRNIKVYYESPDAIVYEIVNREKESRISSVLRNVFPELEENEIKQ